MKKIYFDENRNAFMPNLKMKLALLKGITKAYKYPDYKNTHINETISSFFHFPPEYFCVTAGSLEGINLIVSIMSKNDGCATLFIPTFWGYQDALERYQYHYELVKLNKMIDYDAQLINERAQKSNLIFLCNPNNPTLSFIDKEALIQVVRNNHQCHFVIDETMLIFNEQYSKLSIHDEVRNYPNLSVVMSFSKILGISGLRAGIVFSNPKMIQEMNRVKIPYSNNLLVEKVLPVALGDNESINLSRIKIARNKEELIQEFINLGFRVIDNHTNFILVELGDKYNVDEVVALLCKKGLIVRNIKEAYPELAGNWLRISINNKYNNRKLVKALKSIID